MSGRFAEIERLLAGGVGTAFPSASLAFGQGGLPTTISVGDASETTWFDIASLTKALSTAVLTMHLCETKRLAIDEEILPGVCVAHLLSHSAGFPACFPPLWADKQGLLHAPSDSTRRAVLQTVLLTPRDLAGARSLYSDLGFIVLGDLLEQRGEARLDDQLARLLAPLDLRLGFAPLDRSSPFVSSEVAPTRRETPQREQLVGVVHDDTARAMLGVAGHAGLFGQCESVYRLGQALLACFHDDDTPAVRALGLTSQTVRRFFASPALPGLAGTWGLGFDHPDPIRPSEPCTSSAGSRWSRRGVGHLGFTGCSIWMEPDSRLVAVLLSNRVFVSRPTEADQSKAALRALRPALHDAIVSSVRP